MAKPRRTNKPPKPSGKGGRRPASSEDLYTSDYAFKLVVVHGLSVPRALQLTQEPCTSKNLYKRVRLHTKKVEEAAAKEKAEADAASSSKSPTPFVPTSIAQTRVTRSSTASTLTASPTDDGDIQEPRRKCQKSANKSSSNLADLEEQAVASLPKWCDSDITLENMGKRKNRTQAQACRDQFGSNIKALTAERRYAEVFKKASANVKARQDRGDRSLGGGARAICHHYNNNKLNQPWDHKLKPSTLTEAVRKGRVNVSPEKRGRKRTIPIAFTNALAAHSSMMQVSASEGEACAPKMKTVINALKAGTEWEHKIKDEYAWRRTRMDHPAVMIPCKSKNHEDRRAEWLTVQHINEWTDEGKKFLIEIGLVVDEPGTIFGVDSEVTLKHPDDILRFLNMDETHHELTNEGKKSGSTATRYHNPTFGQAGDRVMKSSRHTTGVYATNPVEALPPLYIFDSKSKDEKNFKLDPMWCEGLPKVRGKWGNGRQSLKSSKVCVQAKGSMDVSLFQEYCKQVIFSLYPNISPTIKRDETGRMVKGPVFLKVDSGPGRLSNDAMNLEFRSMCWDMGFYIFLGLPNGTECTQELDQGYQSFKPAPERSALRVAGMKLAARVKARKKALARQKSGEVNSSSEVGPNPIGDLEEYLHGKVGEDDVPDDDDAYKFEVKKSVCIVTLTNADIAPIVNGFPGDPIELRPFDFFFTRPNIWSWWVKVGFMPMNRNCLKDEKVRHQLGEGGSFGKQKEHMELLVEDYAKCAAELDKLGFNGDVLDAFIEEVEEKRELEGEEETIQKLVEE